jgi:putative ABC transport system substrate-binding protein
MLSTNDPVGQGFAESLAHPGGNITGLTQDDSAKIAAKRVQLLQLAIPHLARVAVLLYPDDPYAQAQWDQLEQAATALNLVLRRIMVRQASDFADAAKDFSFTRRVEGRPSVPFLFVR